MMESTVDVEMQAFEMHNSVLNELQLTAADQEDVLRDRHSSVRSLTIMADQLKGTKTLMAFADSKDRLRSFLVFTGNYWPMSGSCNFAKFFFLCNRAIIFVCALTLAALVVGTTYFMTKNDFGWQSVLFCVLGFVMFVGTLSVLPAQYFNRLRLFVPAEIEDFLVVDECLRVSVAYGVISMACVLAGIVLECVQSTSWVRALLFLTSTCVVPSLMFNMFFLILDLKVSLLLLDQLHILADKKLLTMDKFNLVRAEIHRRVSASRLACDFIIVPALASSVGIPGMGSYLFESITVRDYNAVMAVLLINKASKHTDDIADDTSLSSETEQNVGLVLLLLKELFFVAAAFWYVAKVNGRADDLTRKLSDGFWGQYDNASSVVRFPAKTGAAAQTVELVQLADLHRVSIHMCSVSRPISFTLLFKRVSWENVVVSAVGLGLTVLTSIIKNLAAASAS